MNTPLRPHELRTALDTLFESVNRCDAPGLVVGVAQHGQPLYRRGFGLASLEHGVANTVWTRMRIGSTSKHFTCLAALLLAEDGLLDIDASVRRYVPELPTLQGEPSLRQLMSHTGGYRCYLDIGFLADGTEVISPPGTALRRQVRQSRANFAPGQKMMYCNGGYHLLSLAIERASGQSLRQFLQQRVFLPLGMRDTTLVASDFELHRGMATLHVPLPPEAGGGWRRGIFPSEEVGGDGALISTVGDMLHWLAHLRGAKTVGSDESWRQMLAPARLNDGREIPYALGLRLRRYRGVEVVHHAGGVIGGSSQMITVPAHALDMIVMNNGAALDPVPLAYQIIDTVLGGSLEAEPAPGLRCEAFRPMLGTRYHAPDSGLVIGFDEAPGGWLGLRVMNAPPMPLKEVGAQLQLDLEDLAVGPVGVSAAALARCGEPPNLLDVRDGCLTERLLRLPANPPGIDALCHGGLLGRYHAPDLPANAELLRAGDRLLLTVTGPHGRHVLELTGWSMQVFGWQMPGSLPLAGAVTVERDANQRVLAFRMDTVRTRSMRFERLAD